MPASRVQHSETEPFAVTLSSGTPDPNLCCSGGSDAAAQGKAEPSSLPQPASAGLTERQGSKKHPRRPGSTEIVPLGPPDAQPAAGQTQPDTPRGSRRRGRKGQDKVRALTVQQQPLRLFLRCVTAQHALAC